MNKSNNEKNLEKKITEDLLQVTNVFGNLILNISKNIKADTNYSYTGDDDSINGFVINRIIFILSRANKFLPLYNKQTSLLLPINGGRAVNSSLKKGNNGSIEAIVGRSASASDKRSATKSASASDKRSATKSVSASDKRSVSKSASAYVSKSASASVSKSIGIGKHSNIQKKEVVENRKLYKIFRENCKIHFNSDYTQYYNATVFYRKLVYKNCIEDLFDLLYFYINYNKLKQENEQREGKNGGMKQKGGFILPLCKPASPSIDNSKLGPVKQLYPTLYPHFIPTLKTEMETFLGQGKLDQDRVVEFSSIFQQDLYKDLSDNNRAKPILTKICLQHLPIYNKMTDHEFAALLRDPAAIITGTDFLKPDNYRLVVNTYSIHDTTPSGLKAQIEAWRSDDKLLIIPNISSVLDSAEHSNGGIYDAYKIEKHSEVFKHQLTYIINPAIKALKSFYISLDTIDIEITINAANKIVLTVKKQSIPNGANVGIEVQFGSNGISTVPSVVKRLRIRLMKDLDALLIYLHTNGFNGQEATDISLFIKHMGDSLQFIQCLYHNTEFTDQQDIDNQRRCNTFIDNEGDVITIETQNDTAFLTCDRSAFKAAKALNCNVVIGVGDTKCDSDRLYDKIYWRVAPLIVGLTRIKALVKFFKFCVPYPAPSAQAASSPASRAASSSASQAASSPASQTASSGSRDASSGSQDASSPAAASSPASQAPYGTPYGTPSGTPPGTPVYQYGPLTPDTYKGIDSSSSSIDMSGSGGRKGASGGRKGASGGRKGASGGRKGASGGRKGASGGRKGASGGRKCASGGRKGASGGTLPDQDIDMSTSDSTNHIVANSSGLLYSSEVVGGKTNTTIYLCFTDENRDIKIDKTFFIDTFEGLDLSDPGTFTQDQNAKDFQLIITKIFESSLIELDTEKYVKMLDKMDDDIKSVEVYSTEFQVAFKKNTEAVKKLSMQFDVSRPTKADGIINSTIASYKASFETSLTHLKEIKNMVEDWRSKISVKFENRKNAIKKFMEKIKDKYSPAPENPIIRSTLASCEISLKNVEAIITKFQTFDKKQKAFTIERVEVSDPYLKDKSNTALMSKVRDAVNTFIITLKLRMKKLREEKIEHIKKSIEKTDIEIKEKNDIIIKEAAKLKELTELKKEFKKNGDISNIQAIENTINEKKLIIKNRQDDIKRLRGDLRRYQKTIEAPEKEIDISFNDALRDLKINIKAHTENLMYFLKVEEPVITALTSRKSWRDGTPKDEGEGKGKGKGKQPLQAIQEDDEDEDEDDDVDDDNDDDVHESVYSDAGPSLKKSKTGGKLLNKKVRIHKAKSISQKTISGEKRRR